ncbi:hypothetical protein [Lacrimispora brassicae]
MGAFGMQLTKLQLEGPKKEIAVIEFDSGLNVIAGASDTGKSFAFECINYAFGATEIPEVPNEAVGYEWVLLEFLNKSLNQKITLKRSLLESESTNIYYIYSDISNIETANSETLSISSQAKKSLSSKLLDDCNCSYRNILSKSSDGKTERFTFRKFIYLIMLSETRIVQKNAPIYLGDTKRDRTSTKETSSFFTVLTGLDYQKHLKPENPEIKKAHLKGAIDELTIICGELQKDITETESSLNNLNPQKINAIIKEIEKSLTEQRQMVQGLEHSRQQELSLLDSVIRDKNRILDNLAKFKLLKKNYQSDIDRLEFIEQTHDYTGQLVDIKCPICHTTMKSPKKDNEIYYIAIEKEKEKLKAHLLDLEETINDFDSDLTLTSKRIVIIQDKIEAFNKDLSAQSNKISETLIKHEQYLKIRDQVVAVENNKRKLFDTNSRIQELNDRIDNTKVVSEKVNIKKLSDELMVEFCKIVQNLLEEWTFIDSSDKCSVEFNSKSNDIVVCGKTKASYGKGARAIINSSFLIAIMLYCQQYGLSHPGFIVLDSPLTTYKEKDKQKNEKNEEVSKGVKSAFFNNLSQIGRGRQIIIFDNETPPENLTEIKYQHFTGNPDIDRAGFVPVH